jgi:hypothetical protein
MTTVSPPRVVRFEGLAVVFTTTASTLGGALLEMST